MIHGGSVSGSAVGAVTTRRRCPRRASGPAPRPARPQPRPVSARPGRRTFEKFHPLAAAVVEAPPPPPSHWLAAPSSSATPRPPSAADWPRSGSGAARPPCWEGGCSGRRERSAGAGRPWPRCPAPARRRGRPGDPPPPLPFPGGPALRARCSPLTAASRPRVTGFVRDCAVPLTAPARGGEPAHPRRGSGAGGSGPVQPRRSGEAARPPPSAPAAALRVTPRSEKAPIGPRRPVRYVAARHWAAARPWESRGGAACGGTGSPRGRRRWRCASPRCWTRSTGCTRGPAPWCWPSTSGSTGEACPASGCWRWAQA